jgi:hypothetical protein
MSNTVYSPGDVNISIGGFNVDGWDSITMSRNAENTGKNISADGKVGLTQSADKTGVCEIEVQQQNSAFNSYAAEIQRIQDTTGTLLRFDIVVSDKSGGILSNLNTAHLDVPASQDLSQEAGSRTWAFFVSDMEYLPNIGGFGDLTAISNAQAAVNNLLDNVLNKI